MFQLTCHTCKIILKHYLKKIIYKTYDALFDIIILPNHSLSKSAWNSLHNESRVMSLALDTQSLLKLTPFVFQKNGKKWSFHQTMALKMANRFFSSPSSLPSGNVWKKTFYDPVWKRSWWRLPSSDFCLQQKNICAPTNECLLLTTMRSHMSKLIFSLKTLFN